MWLTTLFLALSVVTFSGTLINYWISNHRPGCKKVRFFLHEQQVFISQGRRWPCLFPFFFTFCLIALWELFSLNGFRAFSENMFQETVVLPDGYNVK